MNVSLITMEVKYDAIDTDDSSCHGYYIIKFYSYPYTLQVDLSNYGQIIYFNEIIYEVTYFFNQFQCQFNML